MAKRQLTAEELSVLQTLMTTFVDQVVELVQELLERRSLVQSRPDQDERAEAAEHNFAVEHGALIALEGDVSRVYDEVTFGMFSKPNTSPSAIIERVEELRAKDIKEAVAHAIDVVMDEFELCSHDIDERR
jgi:hypothetical protein